MLDSLSWGRCSRGATRKIDLNAENTRLSLTSCSNGRHHQKTNGPGDVAGPVHDVMRVDDYMLTKPKSTPVYCVKPLTAGASSEKPTVPLEQVGSPKPVPGEVCAQPIGAIAHTV